MSPSYEELFDSSVALKNELTQDTLADIPPCKGVLFFADSNCKPLQLLQAANLRRTVRAKFLSHDESISRKADVSSLTKNISWRCCYNDFMTQTTYVHLADALFGTSSDKWVQLPRPCFSIIEMDSYLPYFDISNSPATSAARNVFGLFPTRKSALEFCNILNAVFCLCRNPKLLKTGRESSCPYLQMKKCPGPCLNPALKKSYLRRCFEAIKCASGCIQPSLNALDRCMDTAASNMNFEDASELKKRKEQLQKLYKSECRWVHDLKDLCILHVDRTFKVSIEGQRKKVLQYQWFKIDYKAIYDLGICCPQSRQDIEHFLDNNWTTGSTIPFAEATEKHLGNLTFFLYRSKHSGVWMDCSEGIIGERLYPEIERLLGIELPAYCAEKRDTK